MTDPLAEADPGERDRTAVGRVAEALGGVAAFDFLLGFLLLFDRHPIPGVGQPGGMAVIAVALVTSALRRPTHRWSQAPWLVAAYTSMVGFAVVVSQMHGLAWQQRALKIMLLMVFGLALAGGRLDIRSILVGLWCGAVLNIPLYYAGLTPDHYHPHLTGFFGDKNVSGLMYAFMVVAGLFLFRGLAMRVIHLAIFYPALLLTGSRTSLTASLLALAWILLRNRVPMLVRLLLAGGATALIGFLEERYARVGIYADRAGSDWFREQINLATERRVEAAPWFGDGLTTALVQVTSGRSFFFHDSYAALRVEGGLPMLVIMLVIVAIVAGGMFVESTVSRELAIAEGLIVVLLVCAWKLGEVFFTTPCFLALGLALQLRYGRTVDPLSDPGRRIWQ